MVLIVVVNNMFVLMFVFVGLVLLFIVIYVIGFIVLFFWVSVWLMLINVVLVNECVGLGVICCLIVFICGMMWWLIGVLLLFGIVFGVVVFVL